MIQLVSDVGGLIMLEEMNAVQKGVIEQYMYPLDGI